MKHVQFILASALLISSMFFISCGDDEGGGSDTTPPAPGPIITAVDFETLVDENLTTGTSLGNSIASTDDGSSLTYSIQSQSVASAIGINASTGELLVNDASAFNYEQNTSLTAVVKSVSGSSSETSNVTIKMIDDNPIIGKWKNVNNNNREVTITTFSTFNANYTYNEEISVYNSLIGITHNTNNKGTYTYEETTKVLVRTEDNGTKKEITLKAIDATSFTTVGTETENGVETKVDLVHNKVVDK